jgi:CheY-like chemotaxis protein
MQATKFKILMVEMQPDQESYVKDLFSQLGWQAEMVFVSGERETLNAVSSGAFEMVWMKDALFNSYGNIVTVAAKAKNVYTAVFFISHKQQPLLSLRINPDEEAAFINWSSLTPDVLFIIISQVEKLKQIDKELEKLKTEKTGIAETRFLTDISHQFRTPLNSIIGFSAVLLENERTEKEREFLEAIKISGEKILGLMDEKLGNAAPSSSKSAAANEASIPKIHFNDIVKLKILLVDDDILNIKLVEYLLADFGMKADVALNGKLAIDKLAAQNYDLVLMDIEMPVMNGYEATSFIRENLKNEVPIIAVTAHVMAGEKEKCFNAGMNDYITKPIDINHLFKIIYKTVIPENIHQKNEVSPVTNLRYLKESMNGKKEAIKEMLVYILQQLPVYLSELNTAIDAKEFPAIAKLSHKIKSAVAIMGVKQLEPLLTEMEISGKNAGDINAIKNMNRELNRICSKGMEELQQEQLKYL